MNITEEFVSDVLKAMQEVREHAERIGAISAQDAIDQGIDIKHWRPMNVAFGYYLPPLKIVKTEPLKQEIDDE